MFLITLAANVLVAASKGAYALTSGSVALGVDAVHGLLDSAANVLALIGMHYAAAPADARHPYGHRKVEIVAALGIGALIVVGLFEIAGSAVAALLGHSTPPTVGWTGFAVVAASLPINFLVARYEHARGHELQSPLLSADAHHTHADLYTSGAVLLSFAGSRAGLHWADGLCGLALLIMVGRVAWAVLADNLPSLLDAAVLDPHAVMVVARSVDGVAGAHHVRSRGTRWAVELDLHLQVKADMRVDSAHDIAHQVDQRLRAEMPELFDVVIHLEPTESSSHEPNLPRAIDDPTST